MDGAVWLRVVDIFHAALERPEEDRAAFIAAAADGNAEIEREVLAMLNEDRSGVSRLRRGMAEMTDLALDNFRGLPSFAPEKIGPYERQEFLGRGGMGAVWKVVRVDTGVPMAIKLLLLGQFTDLQRKSFANEISSLARLRHPHIVSFHDAGSLDDGTPWFVMDFVEECVQGMRFAAFCRLPGHSIEMQLRLFRTVCDAVSAHLQGIIHRDLKPSNILIAKDGTPRIVDFGIARQLEDPREPVDSSTPTEGFMSPDYAAPEWKYEGRFGARTDVYSLGVILYEVLTGAHPYRKPQASVPADAGNDRKLPEKPSAVVAGEMLAGREAEPSRSAWKDLDKLCLKALHPDPEERYRTVEALIRDIDHYLNCEPLDVQPKMLRYRAGKFVRRHRRAMLASTATLLVIVSMAAFFTWRLANERDVAVAEAARVRHIQGFMTNLLQGGDQEAGPAANLLVTTMIERGVQQAGALNNEPQVQADLYQTLGTMSQRLGRLGQADSLLQTALEKRRSLAEPDPSGIASNLIALGLVRSDEGKAKDAEQLIGEALDSVRSRTPGNKALLGEGQLALGRAMIAAGRQTQAIAVLNQAVATIESAEGARSPDLALALGKLADAQIYAGNYDAADSLNRRALAIDRAVYGENHPRVAEDLGNLAQTQDTRGYYAQAEALEREALAIMEKWYGPNHPETARKLTTLASTLIYEKKKNKEAEELLQRALAIQERVFGPQHPRVAYVLNSMGAVALGEKEFKVAEKDDSRVADIYRQAYGDGDYRVAVALDNLASVYQAEGRYAKCESMLLDVIGRFTRVLGAGNIQTGMARTRLGMALLEDRKYAASVSQSLAGYEILVRQMNPNSGWITGARRDLAAGYMALDEPRKAELFRAGPSAVTAHVSR